VIVFDADFVGMPVLPSECEAILLIDPKAVTACSISRVEEAARRTAEAPMAVAATGIVLGTRVASNLAGRKVALKVLER